MIIERIVSKDDGKAIVYFDNGEKLILHKDVLYQSGLRKGDEISSDRFSSLNQSETFYLIKQKAFRLLQRRIHSARELYTKLRQKFPDDNLIRKCIDELNQKGFIDDRKFALDFITEKQRTKKWSKSRLKSELVKRGIASEIISEVLRETFDNNREIESAEELVQKKFRQLVKKEEDKRKLFQKLLMYLQSKGYEYDLASEVVRKVLKVEDED